MGKSWARVAGLLVGFTAIAFAHSREQTAILLDFHGPVVDAEVQLPAEALQWQIGTRDSTVVASYVAERLLVSLPDGSQFAAEPLDTPRLSSIEGAPYLVAHIRFVAPPGHNADVFNISSRLLPQQAQLVSIRNDWRTGTFANNPQLAGVLRGNDRTLRVSHRAGSWWNGFGAIFRLGMEHIASGTDHLLFLLALLLPAPLAFTRNRWAGYIGLRTCLFRIAKVVTAFTVGHSVTLALGAMDRVHVPARPIEVLIAVSILISALHALRPLFPGRESVIAGCFGLVHGLAFATTMAQLGLSRWERVAGIFSFNLGIEAMQLLVVAAALPSLILLSRTRLYAPVRVTGAVFAGSAAAAWIVQRIWDVANPADAIVAALAQRGLWIAAGLTLLGIFAQRSRSLRLISESLISEREMNS